jgi:hypothetical protein
MVFPIERFIVVKKTNVIELVAELSDLSAVHENPFHRVYPDACDEGLTIIGKTGQEVTYAINRRQVDREGDLQFIELIPTRESIRKVPASRATKIILFND